MKPKISIRITALSLLPGLIGCGGSTSAPVPDLPPQNVRLVSGDGNDSEVQNTISWTRDANATDYTVYWDTVPGVSQSSSVVVPTTQGASHVVHSGMDVTAGAAFYYRVQATTAGGASPLSAEVTGTPQLSVTNKPLNDVAWNGVDTLIAVGDNGVVLRSPNGTTDGWVDATAGNTQQSLTGVTWENVNSQFLIVGAGSTVLSGDGTNWNRENLSNLQGALNLEDIAWLGENYIAVGKRGAIVTSNGNGSVWTLQDAGTDFANIAFNAVASNGSRIVVVGTNGAILHSVDSVSWDEVPKFLNQDLNDISWDGNQFLVVGSNDTILTSPDGISWTSHSPGTSDINFVAATHWDSELPRNPVLAAVGSAGTLVISPDGDPGVIVRTGTTQRLGGITRVDSLIDQAYFVMVGNDGTVLTSQFQ